MEVSPISLSWLRTPPALVHFFGKYDLTTFHVSTKRVCGAVLCEDTLSSLQPACREKALGHLRGVHTPDKEPGND